MLRSVLEAGQQRRDHDHSPKQQRSCSLEPTQHSAECSPADFGKNSRVDPSHMHVNIACSQTTPHLQLG